MLAKRTLAALAAVVMSLLGAVVPASPAAAAPIRCAAGEAKRLSSGKFYMTVGYTSAPRYTGKPFSFKLTVVDQGVTSYRYRTFTYTGTSRSFTSPVIKRQTFYNNPRPYKLEAWQAGQRCTDWVW